MAFSPHIISGNRYARQSAYQQRVLGCVPLREPAPALPAETAQIVDTRVDTGRPGSRQLPGQTSTNVDMRTAPHRSPGTFPVSKC